MNLCEQILVRFIYVSKFWEIILKINNYQIILHKFISVRTTERGPALVSSPLDGCPGVAGGHEVGVLPRGGVHGSTRLVQVAVGVGREGVVGVHGGHAVGPAGRLHGGEGGGGGHLVAGGELSPGRVPTEAVHRDPVIVVAEQDTLGGVAGSGGGPGIGAVDVGVVVIFPPLGGVAQAGVQPGPLVSQGQRAVSVGQVVEEGAPSHGQPHSPHPTVLDVGALQYSVSDSV